MPEVVNIRGDVLGTFAGFSPTLEINGNFVSGMTTVTPTAYILRLTNEGELGLLASAYFAEPGCKGTEFVPAKSADSGGGPFNGLVYRSFLSGEVRYIERYESPNPVEVRSRAGFSPDQKSDCEEIESILPLFRTRKNNAEITGFSENSGATIIALEHRKDARLDRSLLERLAGSDASDSQPIPMDQQECAPGCTWQNLGNNACNISCYVEACNYDGGDCDNESQEFIQAEQAKFCSPGCDLTEVGDGFCDSVCNNSACNFDGGDCTN